MALVTDLNARRGRSQRQLAHFLLCALVALCGALLFAERDARAQQLDDVANGVTQQSGDAAGGGGAQSADGGGGGGGGTQTSNDGAVAGTGGGAQVPVDASGGGGIVDGGGGQPLTPVASGADPAPVQQTGTVTATEPLAPVPAPTQQLAEPVQQVAAPVIGADTPAGGSVAGTLGAVGELAPQAIEPVVGTVDHTLAPIQRSGGQPAVEQVWLVAEPVAGPAVRAAEPVGRIAGPAVEPAVGAVEPVRRVAQPAAEAAAPVSGPAAAPTQESAVEPGAGAPAAGEEFGVRPAEKPSVAEPPVLRAAGQGVGQVAKPPTSPLSKPGPVSPAPSTTEGVDLGSAFAASGYSEDLALRLPAREREVVAVIADPPGPHGSLDLAVGARLVDAGSPLARAASDRAPQPLPPGGVPAGVDFSGGLGFNTGVGAGLAILVLLLFFVRAGGSLSWLSGGFSKPNSIPVAITERPG